MKLKYLLPCLGAMLVSLSTATAMQWGYPVSVPTPATPYDQYRHRMTKTEQAMTKNTLRQTESVFEQNHNLCSSRAQCLNSDERTMVAFINRNPYHPARSLLLRIYNDMVRDAANQKFTTQWFIYQNLSPQRQREYINGTRIWWIQPKMILTSSGRYAIAQYNSDDLFTALLGRIQHNHARCSGFKQCYSLDIQTIRTLSNELDVLDPLRTNLRNLISTLKHQAETEKFNSVLYLKLHTPFPDWEGSLQKRKNTIAVNSSPAEIRYNQWREIERVTQPTRWYAARIINSAPPRTTLVQRQPVYGSPVYQPPVYTPTQTVNKGSWFNEVLNLAKPLLHR